VASASIGIWTVGVDRKTTSSEELIASYGLNPKGVWEPFHILLPVP
jgi:hypothetical protein